MYADLFYLSVGLSSLILRPSLRPFRQGFAKYSKSRAFFFKKTNFFAVLENIASFNVPFSWAFLKRRVTCHCVTYKQYMFRTYVSTGLGNFGRFGQ